MKKCKKGKLGYPRFKVGDTINFDCVVNGKDFVLEGEVGIVDAFGTFCQDEEPSYDIDVADFPFIDGGCFVKHVRESDCYVK